MVIDSKGNQGMRKTVKYNQEQLEALLKTSLPKETVEIINDALLLHKDVKFLEDRRNELEFRLQVLDYVSDWPTM